ncbi:MAG: carboxylating nicotinate-nucleotide diphosphorylase [Thermoplasmata archaeon]|nr:carboxylating nicotinate-nucleotide diphosphorylase [Thermoplasmata archaeon]
MGPRASRPYVPLPRDLDPQLRRALAEDRVADDRTSRAVLPPGTQLVADVVAQGAGVLSGAAVAERLAQLQGLRSRRLCRDGDRLVRGTRVLELRGDARRVLGVERTLLNYLMHLSGVASQTSRAVVAARGRLTILGTRKTVPGLRDLEKAAIVHGGGQPHRRDLSDALLIKSNHLAAVELGLAIARARRGARGRPIEVEVRSLAQARAAVAAGARSVLIDNAGPRGAQRIVSGLERLGLRRGLTIELSGGLTDRTIGRYLRVGADSASLGSLTHSVTAVPFHLVVRRVRPC